MSITIRKATSQDYSALCELFDELDALHYTRLPHIFQKPDRPARGEDYFSHLTSDKNAVLFVAVLGARLVGLVEALVREMPPVPVFVPRQFVMVDSIVVRSEYQNKDIGRRLMAAVDEWAAAKGAASIELNVFEFNTKAIAFYQNLGYTSLSRKMEKKLKP